MPKTFLVGSDGSPCATRAAELAAAQAEAQGASLVLLAVVEWSRYAFYTPEELNARTKAKEAEVQKAQSQVLEPLAAQLGEGLAIKSLVRHGHAAEVLQKVAEEEQAEQIFIGRHGRSRLETALFGSVTNRILQLATVPVTVVP